MEYSYVNPEWKKRQKKQKPRVGLAVLLSMVAMATVVGLFGGVLLCSDDMSAYTPEARALYDELLRNRDAEDIQVHADGELRVTWRLDGEKREIVIPD